MKSKYKYSVDIFEMPRLSDGKLGFTANVTIKKNAFFGLWMTLEKRCLGVALGTAWLAPCPPKERAWFATYEQCQQYAERLSSEYLRKIQPL